MNHRRVRVRVVSLLVFTSERSVNNFQYPMNTPQMNKIQTGSVKVVASMKGRYLRGNSPARYTSPANNTERVVGLSDINSKTSRNLATGLSQRKGHVTNMAMMAIKP